MVKQLGRILFSAMRTPDGTLLVSKSTWDYVTHQDKNGKFYMLDGGLDYVRSTINDDQVMIQITDKDAFEDIREVFTRGGRGKDGRQPLKWVPLCEMSDEWLKATLRYCEEFNTPMYADLYEEELHYRAKHNISIPE